MNIEEERKLYKEAQIIARKYIGKTGVTDIEFGLKHQNGQLTNEISLRFKVKEKKSEKKLKRSEILPKQAGKFKTDVLLDKIFRHLPRNDNPRNIVRPLIGGIQIQSGIYTNTTNYWGTMGCFYQIQNHVFGFTNYHVLYGGATPDIVSNSYIGRLPIFQNLNRQNNRIGVASNLFSYELDYATFVVQTPIDQLQSINTVGGLLSSYTYPQINMKVLKSGASTGLTFGIIDGRSCLDCSELSIHIDPSHPNPNGVISSYGDSGSVWLLNDNTSSLKPVALHYGGGESPEWAKAKTFSSIFASIRNKIQNQNLLT